MGRYRVPRSIFSRDLFRRNEDHIWHNGHTFQPGTSISRPPASYSRRSLIILRSKSWPAEQCCDFAPSVVWFIARSHLCEVVARKPSGSFERELPRHPLYSIVKGSVFYPLTYIFHTIFRFERNYLINFLIFFRILFLRSLSVFCGMPVTSAYSRSLIGFSEKNNAWIIIISS